MLRFSPRLVVLVSLMLTFIGAAALGPFLSAAVKIESAFHRNLEGDLWTSFVLDDAESESDGEERDGEQEPAKDMMAVLLVIPSSRTSCASREKTHATGALLTAGRNIASSVFRPPRG